MKITLKTLKGQQLPLEVEPEMTVGSPKQQHCLHDLIVKQLMGGLTKRAYKRLFLHPFVIGRRFEAEDSGHSWPRS